MTNTKEDVVLDRNSNSLIWISSLSNFFSWVVLVVFLALTAFQVYGTVLGGGRLGFNLNTLYTVINWLIFPVVGIAIFLLLQAGAKALLMLMDIVDNTCPDVDEDVEVIEVEQP